VFATAGNWTPSGPPSNSDTATFDWRAVDDLDGSDQSAILLAQLVTTQGMGKAIGSVTTPLQIGATLVRLGVPSSDRTSATMQAIHLALGSTASTIHVYQSATTGGGVAPVTITNAHSGSVLYVYGGLVGVAVRSPGQTSQLSSVHVVGAGTLTTAPGVTLANANVEAGRYTLQGSLVTLNAFGGETLTEYAGTITTANLRGRAQCNSSGTITTLNVESGGVADFSGSRQARTVTNCNVYGTGRIVDPYGVVTFTNGVVLSRGAKTSQVEIGGSKTVTIA
jgi:hypothetical protein